MKLPVRLVTTATGMLIAGASAAGGAGTLCARGGTSAHSSVSATSAAPAVMAGTESQGTASATLSASGTPPSMTRIVIPSQHLRDASATVSARPAHTGDDSAGSVDGQFGAASGGQAATSAIANPQASTATVAPGTDGSTDVASSLRNVMATGGTMSTPGDASAAQSATGRLEAGAGSGSSSAAISADVSTSSAVKIVAPHN